MKVDTPEFDLVEDLETCEKLENMLKRVANDIDRTVNYLRQQGCTKFRVRYRNVLDEDRNPWGIIACFRVTGK